MSITWPSRFFLLLIPSALGLFFFFSTHVRTPGVTLEAFGASGGITVSHSLEDDSIPYDAYPPANILLVTSFFPLSKSKHTMREYENWLTRFLEPIATDIYFYAPAEMESLIRKCRGDLPIIINTTYTTPFDIPPLDGARNVYYKMQAQDRERARHSPELYAVWAAKPYFLDEAVQSLARVGKVYDYAFWNDAGSFRFPHKYTNWPSPARVRSIWEEGSALSGEKAEDLLFFPIAGLPHPSMKYWVQDHGPVDTEFSEGSFFGGSPRTVAWWRRTYYAYHDHYLHLGQFVGKDQTLINAIFLLFPSRIIAVWLDDPDAPGHKSLPLIEDGALGNCGAEWFYYQFWLAQPAEQKAMHELWDTDSRWSWDWWRKRQECRVTRVSAMKDLLQRRFGHDWEPPLHTINT
ncbi:hypothetical protein DFH07DRAFT_741680 [Mycena maculata]|uniref:Uncharacterized protein n=1 Tax=Mycena maculata TaxID=230809 RepID=A0AAD7J7C1_9AGAR|nr:hypothetical protein DFH07DRAFT_741680 [Mycena maculata]